MPGLTRGHQNESRTIKLNERSDVFGMSYIQSLHVLVIVLIEIWDGGYIQRFTHNHEDLTIFEE